MADKPSIENISTEKFDMALRELTEMLVEAIQERGSTPGPVVAFSVYCLDCGGIHRGMTQASDGLPSHDGLRRQILSVIGKSLVDDNNIPLAVFLCAEGRAQRLDGSKHEVHMTYNITGLTCDGRTNLGIINVDGEDHDKVTYVDHALLHTDDPEKDDYAFDLEDLQSIYSGAVDEIFRAVANNEKLSAVFDTRIVETVKMNVDRSNKHEAIARMIQGRTMPSHFTVKGLKDMPTYERTFDLNLLRN